MRTAGMGPPSPTTLPTSVRRLSDIRLAMTTAPWPVATDHAAAIAEHWRARVAENPSFFDGQVCVLRHLSVSGDTADGAVSLERFSAFLYWRDGRSDDDATLDGFATAVVRSAEGRILVGRAAARTLNAGRVYLPGGFLDGRDVGADGTIDVDASVTRELTEETGLAVGDLVRQPGYILARHGRYCCFAVEFRSPLDSTALAGRIKAGMGTADGELTETLFVNSLGDLDRYDVLSHSRLVIEHVLFGSR